ncbi:MAG: hypothetical protein RIC80_17250 [Cyclobacteriaceae bacterium]
MTFTKGKILGVYTTDEPEEVFEPTRLHEEYITISTWEAFISDFSQSKVLFPFVKVRLPCEPILLYEPIFIDAKIVPDLSE